MIQNGKLNRYDDVLSILPTGNASGAIASFDDGADAIPLVNLVANIKPVQEGSGTPSKTNLRNITGFTSCIISHSGTDTSISETKTIDLETLTGGTVYGGNITINEDGSGVLTVTHALITVTAETAIHKTRVNNNGVTQFIYNLTPRGNINRGSEIKCNALNIYPTATVWNYQTAGTVAWGNDGSTAMLFVGAPSGITSGQAWRDWLNEIGTLQVYYRRVNAAQYPINSIGQLKTLLGENNILANTGDVNVTYRQDLSILLNKINQRLATLDERIQALENA